jgi:ribosomal protein S18 acetylase RimI-like enzyme
MIRMDNTMEKEIKISAALKSDFPPIAELIAEQNQTPERQCIHSSSGSGPDSILNTMVKWDEIGEIIFVVAKQGERIFGVMGCEFDEGLGRGWLWGPFVLVDDWSGLAAALYHGLCNALPAPIRQLDTFLNVLNQQGQDFYRDQGFLINSTAHVYRADGLTASVDGLETCPPLAPEYYQGFIALHSTIFPGAYYSADRVIQQIDDQNQVFIYFDGNQVLGYVYASFEGDSSDGEVEFLGVREDARGRGIGRSLLRTALIWLFDEHNASQVTLTVNQENVNARALYERVGFRLKYTGVGAVHNLDE